MSNKNSSQKLGGIFLICASYSSHFHFSCDQSQGATSYGGGEMMELLPRTHRHRFEFNPAYREQMEEAGFIVSATLPDGTLAEVVELRDHPYMIATQAHPELASRPTHPHPLFMGLIAAMVK